MSRRLGLAVSAAVVLLAAPAWALDPGTASGHYTRDGVTLGFSHAVALAQDNAEGMLDHPNEIRVALSDIETPPAALEGLAFPPIRGLARAGRIRGLLLEFDPADREALQVTVLAPPAEPGQSLTSVSLSSSRGVWRRLEVNATRIVGEYQPMEDDDTLIFAFSAPVFSNPVEADLRGAAAQASEPVRVLAARAEAIRRGDLASALALSTAGSSLREAPPAALKGVAGEAIEEIKQLKAARRVVVRRDTAAVLGPDGGWRSLAREDGAWKAAD